MGEGATLDSGDLAGRGAATARSPIDIPTIIWRALSTRARLGRHRRVHAFSGVHGLRVRSRDERPLPLQVDGDYIGEVDEARVRRDAARDRWSSPSRAPPSRVARRCCLVALGAARDRRAGADVPAPRAPAARRAARCSRPTTRGTSGSTGCRWPGTRRADREHRARRPGAPGLRVRALQRRAERDPVSRSSSSHARRVPVALPVRRRSPTAVRIRCRAGVADRGRLGSSGDRHVIVVDRDTCTDYELFAAYPHDGGTRWTRRLGRDLQPRSNHLRRPAGPRPTPPGCRSSPAWPATTRSRPGDRPRAALHRAVHGAAVRLPGAPRSVHLQRAVPAADGPARAPEGERQHLGAARTRRAWSRRRSSATG